MTRVGNSSTSLAGLSPAWSASRSSGGARGDSGGFGEQLAERYRVLANDDEALEAAKLVVQALPWLSAPQEQLRLVRGGVVARGAVARAAGGRGASRLGSSAPLARPSEPGAPSNLTLHLQIDGDQVDIVASAAHRETVERLLAARDEVARVLRDRGLKLRRLVATEAEREADAVRSALSKTAPVLGRSYMEVIA